MSTREAAGPTTATATTPTLTKKLRLSDIRLHEYDITIPLTKRVKIHTDAFAASSAIQAPPQLQVAYWDDAAQYDKDTYTGPYYVLTGSDTYRGAARSGRVTHAECVITVCESEADFLARHAILNRLPTGYDPLRLGRMVRMLQQQQQSDSDSSRRAIDLIMKSCMGTIDQKFITLSLDDEAARIISSTCEWLGERLTRFDLPYYIPHAISRVAPGMQAEMAEQISLVIRSGNVTDTRFAWPAPEEIAIMADTPLFRGESIMTSSPQSQSQSQSQSLESPDDTDTNDRNVTIAVPEGEDCEDAVTTTTNTATKKSKNSPRRQKADNHTDSKPSKSKSKSDTDSIILPNTRDVIIIPGTAAHAPYVVDLRTKRVSVVDERADITVLREIGSESAADTKSKKRPAYLMPHAACEWLLADRGGRQPSSAADAECDDDDDARAKAANAPTVRMQMFDSLRAMEAFAKKQSKAVKDGKVWRGVIIYK